LSLYDLQVETLSGEHTTLGEVAGGNAALIVNVASRCGLTPQYEQLQELHSSTDGLTVIGVPCNQFAEEEPGSPEEIATFCSTTYGVTFPLLAKSYVRGRRRSPLFAALTRVADGAGTSGDVEWNFEKWLIAPDGEPVARFRPNVEPLSEEITQRVAQVIARP
jgi:glutathione peroxidase